MTEHPFTGVAVLRRFPVRIWARQQEYYDGLLREFNLMLLGQETGSTSGAPARLVELANDLTGRFGALLATISEERESALARGEVTIDSHVPMIDGGLEIMTWVKGVFAEVDAFCEQGDMLTLGMPEDLKAFRDWSTTEIARQYGGGEPEPWPGPIQ